MQQIIAQTSIATGIFGLKLQKYRGGGGLDPLTLPPPRNYGPVLSRYTAVNCQIATLGLFSLKSIINE